MTPYVTHHQRLLDAVYEVDWTKEPPVCSQSAVCDFSLDWVSIVSVLSMYLSSLRRAAPSSGENGDDLIGKRKKNPTADSRVVRLLRSWRLYILCQRNAWSWDTLKRLLLDSQGIMLVPAVTFPPLWLVKLAERFCSTPLTGFPVAVVMDLSSSVRLMSGNLLKTSLRSNTVLWPVFTGLQWSPMTNRSVCTVHSD